MYNSNSINQQSFENNDNTKITKGKIIYWKSVKNEMTTNDIIQIKSNKAQNIEMKTTNEKTKKQLIKNEKIDEEGYFEFHKDGIKDLWDDGVGGKILAVPYTIWVGAFTIVPIMPAIYYQDRYSDNESIKKQLKSKDNYNTQSKIFNDKLKQTKQLEKHILLKFSKLEKQEKKLNSYNFAMERFYNLNNKSKIIMVIGPTGFGKSLVANRLLGNKEDIDNISESKQCEFKVAMTGNTNSVTNTLNKKSKIVNIINGKEEKEKEECESYILSVIDTPGAFDSNGCDNNYNNIMTHYFKACGGINVFGIFFRFNGKITSKYKELIKTYVKFFGEKLWKHCCVFITYCDMDSKKGIKRIKKGLQKTKDQINLFLKEISNNKNINIPIYMFGEDNFKKSTNDLLLSLTDQNCPFYNKYKCENIESPIDFLYKQLQMDVEQHNILLKQMEIMSKQLKKTGDGIYGARAENHTVDGDCPLQHGLQKCVATSAIRCDGCGKSITTKTDVYGCIKCQYALCPNCHVK